MSAAGRDSVVLAGFLCEYLSSYAARYKDITASSWLSRILSKYRRLRGWPLTGLDGNICLCATRQNGHREQPLQHLLGSSRL